MLNKLDEIKPGMTKETQHTTELQDEISDEPKGDEKKGKKKDNEQNKEACSEETHSKVKKPEKEITMESQHTT